jgi:2-C-methyl-D-erythritol 4-phosphate cytidylyltransferase
MANFSVLILTAAPPGAKSQPGEASGALAKIDGREALLRSVELFLNRDNVKQVQLCFLPEQLDEGKRKYGPHLSFSGVKVLSGGPRWIDQIAAAAGKIAPDCTHVIIHDAARPAVPYSDIDALMEAAEKSTAVVLAAPLRAPIIEVDEGQNPMAIHPQSQFMQLLAPQVLSRSRFDELAASRQDLHASEWRLLAGSGLNVRLNSPGDAQLVKAMLGMLPKPKMKAASSPFDEAQW